MEILKSVQKHPGNEAQSSVVGNAPNMIHCHSIFIVRKGIYGHLFVFGTFFGPKTENAHRNLNVCPKTPKKGGTKISTWMYIKNNESPRGFHC